MFCRSSASQSSVFKSGKLLLISIPSWVQRPRDQPPSSEPWETIQNVRTHRPLDPPVSHTQDRKQDDCDETTDRSEAGGQMGILGLWERVVVSVLG